MFEWNVCEKISSIEKGQVILQFDTALNHLQEEFELSSIDECLVQKDSEFFVLNFDVVRCCGHIFFVCFTKIINLHHNKKKSPTFFSRGLRKKKSHKLFFSRTFICGTNISQKNNSQFQYRIVVKYFCGGC